MKTRFFLKNKIYNHLLKNGNKEVCEKIFSKTIKELQKSASKNSKDIIITAVLLAAPTFKIHVFKRKKRKKKVLREVPYFIRSNRVQLSFAIKLILKSLEDKNFEVFKTIKNEFLIGAKNSSKVLVKKKTLHDFVSTKKNLLIYYKW